MKKIVLHTTATAIFLGCVVLVRQVIVDIKGSAELWQTVTDKVDF